MKFHHSEDPVLDEELAGQILANVLEACQAEPNSIPLEVLTSYSNYRRERYSFQKFTLILIMILFCLLPFLFIYPDYTIQPESSDTAAQPVYQVNPRSLLPVESVVADLNGKRLPVSETEEGIYTVTPDANGKLTVSVTLINNQTNTQTIIVDDLDTKAPVYLYTETKNHQVYLYLEDEDSGIDFEKATAIDEAGNRISADAYNEADGAVIFDYPEASLDVYIPDKAGNTLHLCLTVQ